MSLKFVYANEADIPEDHKALYKKVGTVWELDVGDDTGSEHSTVKSLNNALGHAKKERGDAKDSADASAVALKEAQDRLEAFKDIDPELAREAQKQMQEIADKKLLDAGQIDELLAQRTETMRKDFEGQITAKDELIGTLTGNLDGANTQLADLKIFSEVESIAVSKGARPEALGDIKNRARPIFKLEDGGVVAYDDAGEKLYGKDTAGLTIGEWLDGLSKDASHLFGATTGGGSQGGGDANDGDEGSVRTIHPDQAGQFLDEIADGKVQLSE